MDSIEDFVKIDVSVEQGVLLATFTTLDSDITSLRALKLIGQIKDLFEELKDDRVKSFAMLFDIRTIKIVPTEYINTVIELFKENKPLFLSKLRCSFIVMNSIIITPMKLLLNQFYEPTKPLFLCKTVEECKPYLSMNEDNEEYKNNRFLS